MWFVCRSGNLKTSLQQPYTSSFFSPSITKLTKSSKASLVNSQWCVKGEKSLKKSVSSEYPCLQHGQGDKALVRQEFTRKLQGNSAERLFYQVIIKVLKNKTI